MGIAGSNDGATAYITTGRGSSVSIGDTRTDEVTATIADVGVRPWGVAVDRDGLVYTANGPSNDISVIDPKTRAVIDHIAAGESPWGIAIAR